MKSLFLILGFIFFTNTQSVFAQSDYFSTIEHYQRELNVEFKSKDDSPLEKKDRRQFEALEFFPIDSNFKVLANFARTPDQELIKMKTSTERTPVYKKYGEINFLINSVSFNLTLYQNQKYKESLFLPFKDNTNGNETYGGGRYLDIKIPSENIIEIDFNKAYNPYCAYSHRYSCPIVPTENTLDVKIIAGVKAFNH